MARMIDIMLQIQERDRHLDNFVMVAEFSVRLLVGSTVKIVVTNNLDILMC